MATAKLRDALAEILPTADSTDNNQISDVVGNKDDTYDGNSLVSILRRVEKRLNNASKVYPTLANGVTLTSGVAAWELGSAVEIVPVETITNPFLIYWVKVESASATDIYELILYSGVSADVEIGRFRTNRDTTYPQAGGVAISTEIIAANSKISGKIASQTGGEDTLTVSIHFVELTD